MSLFSRLARMLGGGEKKDAPREETLASAPDRAPVQAPVRDEHADAIEAMNRAEIDVRALLHAVDALSKDGREGEALRRAASVAARTDAPLTLRVELARRRALRGEDAMVVDLLASAGDPTLDALLLLGDAYQRLGQGPQARNCFERALAIDVRSGAAQSRLQSLGSAQADASKAMTTMLGESSALASRYRVLRLLGRGGAGMVMLARDEKLGRNVALKVYHARGDVARARLLHEANSASRLDMHGVVKILDVDPDNLSLTMPWHESGSLAAMIESRAMSADKLRACCRQIALTLAAIHECGFVHRDVKASNVLMDDDGHPVLTDFGLMRSDGHVLNAAEAIEGTPGIVPPEARDGVRVTPAFDAFALGSLLASMTDTDAKMSEVAARLQSVDASKRPSMREVAELLA